MPSCQRHGFKWSVNETLQLQREYKLLKLPIDEIAKRHKRSITAIVYKIDNEEFDMYTTEEEEWN